MWFTSLDWCICDYFHSFWVINFGVLDCAVIETTKMIYFVIIRENSEISIWASNRHWYVILAAFHEWVYHWYWHALRMETTVMTITIMDIIIILLMVILMVTLLMITTRNWYCLFFNVFVLFWGWRRFCWIYLFLGL